MITPLLVLALTASAGSKIPFGPELPPGLVSDQYGPVTAPEPVAPADAATTTAESRAQRLLGAEGTPASASAAPAENGAGLRAWSIPLGIGGLAVAGVFARRRRGMAAAGSQPMQVVQRIALGEKSFLVVVDIPGVNGATRRLVVGTGNGSPSLVSDLGEVDAPARVSAAAEPAECSAPLEPSAPQISLPEVAPAADFAAELAAAVEGSGPTDRELGAPRLEPIADDSASASFFDERRGEYFTDADFAPLPEGPARADAAAAAARVAARLVAASRAARVSPGLEGRAISQEKRPTLKELAQRGTERAGLVPEPRSSAMAARVYVPFAAAGGR
jgi:hypothetical protein